MYILHAISVAITFFGILDPHHRNAVGVAAATQDDDNSIALKDWHIMLPLPKRWNDGK